MAKTKTVTIIARYLIKRLGLVCYQVRNGGDAHYCVTLHPRKHTASCTCDGNSVWHKQCYHITHCLAVEAARNASQCVQAQETTDAEAEARRAAYWQFEMESGFYSIPGLY